MYIDLKVEDDICDFCFKTANAAKIIEFISLKKGVDIDENTLLVFDEVQECPNVISALKYFCQDYRHVPVIATGSMVRIKLQREAGRRKCKISFSRRQNQSNNRLPSHVRRIFTQRQQTVVQKDKNRLRNENPARSKRSRTRFGANVQISARRRYARSGQRVYH